MKLYDAALSGNCHKVRLMLSLLGLDYEKVPVNLQKQDQKTPAHLARHPLGKVPVLEDGDVTIWDSQAILVYLARKYDKSGKWLPSDPVAQAQVTQWLSVAVNEMFAGCALSRAIVKLGRTGDLDAAQALARNTLKALDDRLSRHDWLVGKGPTIADVAVYPYAGLAWEGNIDLEPYKALRAWRKRIEVLPGYVNMPGLAGT